MSSLQPSASQARSEADAPSSQYISEREFFRPEAIEHSTPGLAARDGQIFVSVPPRTMWLGMLCAGAVLIVALGGALVPFSRTETASGWLAPPQGLVRIKAVREGTVSSFLADEGEQVAEGAPIVALSHRVDGASGELGIALTRQLALEADAIAREALVADQDVADRLGFLARRLASLDEQISADTQTGRLYDEQLRLAVQARSRAEALSQSGFLSAAALELAQSRRISAETAVFEQRARRRVSELQREETLAERARILSERERGRADEAQRLAGIEQRRLSTVSDAATMAIAPMAGRIVGLLPERGRAVAQGDTLAVMSLGEGPLVAEVYVSQRGIGRIAPGQEVRVNLDAFPYQTFGSIPGEVVSVSKTPFAPSEIDVAGLEASGAAFKVRVTIKRQQMRAYGNDVVLTPGMAVSAFIVTDRRSLLAWILDPILAAGRG